MATVHRSTPVDGRAWPVRVKPGLSGTLEFDDVEKHQSFECDIRALGGLIKSDAESRLEPGDEAGLANIVATVEQR